MLAFSRRGCFWCCLLVLRNRGSALRGLCSLFVRLRTRRFLFWFWGRRSLLACRLGLGHLFNIDVKSVPSLLVVKPLLLLSLSCRRPRCLCSCSLLLMPLLLSKMPLCSWWLCRRLCCLRRLVVALVALIFTSCCCRRRHCCCRCRCNCRCRCCRCQCQ